jgi:predicted Co/Zn/Cd cation transporter (cation efflux family)
VTVAICAGIFVYERRANRQLGSDFVGLDARSWAVSGAITAALLVAFVAGRALEGSAHADLVPYVDPAVLALVCLVIAPIPLGTVRQAVSEVLLMAPPELVAHVESAAREVVQRHGFADFEAYVAKIGRSQQIELCFVVPAAFPIGDIRTLDAIRDEVGHALGGEGTDRWLTIIFTGDQEWAR